MEDVKQLAERQLGDDSIQLDCINMHNVVSSRTETTVFGPVKHSFIRCRFVVYVKSSGTGVTKMVLTWKSILEKVDTLYQEHEIDPEKDPTVSLINADFSNTEDLISAIKLHLRALGINYHCINAQVDIDGTSAVYGLSTAVDMLYKELFNTIDFIDWQAENNSNNDATK